MATILIIIGGVILLFFAAVYSPHRVGYGIRAFCLWLSQVFAMLAGISWQIQSRCKLIFLASLNLPRSHVKKSAQQPAAAASNAVEEEEEPYWRGYDLITRLVILIPSLGVILGDLVSNTLRSVPLLKTIAVDLPVQIDAIAGLLWFAAPCLLGLVLCDLVGLTPSGSRLFPEVAKVMRICLGIVVGLLFLLTLVDVAYFYLYGQEIIDKIAKTDPSFTLFGESLTDLPLYISTVLGWVMAVDSVIAFIGCVIGLCGLFSLAVGLGYCIFYVTYGLCTIAGIQLATFGGGKVPWHPILLPQPRPLNYPALVSSPDVEENARNELQTVVPHNELLQEVENVNIHKRAALLFGGTAGSELFPYVKDVVEKQQAAPYILSSGSYDRAVPIPRVLPGTQNISPTISDRNDASLPDLPDADIQMAMYTRMAHKLVDKHVDIKGLPIPIVALIDCHDLLYTEGMLSRIHQDLRESSVLVVTVLSGEDLLSNDRVQAGMNLLVRLWQNKQVTGIVVVDTLHSKFVATNGKKALYTFLAKALVDSIVAPYHHDDNLNNMQLFERLFASSPFATFSFVSDRISAGELPERSKGWLWLLLSWLGVRRGIGNSRITIDHTTRLIKETLKPTTCALDVPLYQSGESLILCEVPIRGELDQVQEEISWYVKSRVPHAWVVTVRANGTRSVRQLPDRFFVQVSHLWSLPTNWFQPKEVIEAESVTKELPAAEEMSKDHFQKEQVEPEKERDVPTSVPQPVPADGFVEERTIEAGTNGTASAPSQYDGA